MQAAVGDVAPAKVERPQRRARRHQQRDPTVAHITAADELKREQAGEVAREGGERGVRDGVAALQAQPRDARKAARRVADLLVGCVRVRQVEVRHHRVAAT